MIVAGEKLVMSGGGKKDKKIKDDLLLYPSLKEGS